jgi:predicted dehydrogenase
MSRRRARKGELGGERLSRRPASRDVRIGVVGLGYWGPNLLRNFHELPDARVVAICDLREELVRYFGARYPGVRTTTSFESLIEDEDVEAIAVATPVGTHFELAAAALEASKHVFVEKPLARSSAEAVALIEKADDAGLLLMPGHTFVYSPPVQLIRELISAGELGEIHFISSSRVNLGIHQPDVSVVWDLGAHDFSILRYWLDETPARVMASSRSCVIPATADVAFISLEYDSGTLAHVEMSWLAPSKLRRTALVGSKKMVVYDDTSNEPVRIFDSGVTPRDPETFGEYRLTYRSGSIVSPPVEAAEPLSLEVADFCRSVREGVVPRSSAEFGLEVVRTIEAVDRSLDAGGVAVVADSAVAR